MDIMDYADVTWDDDAWSVAFPVLSEDVSLQLGVNGIETVQVIDDGFGFRTIARKADGQGALRYVLVTVGDVRCNPMWFNMSRLCRTNSIHDWKGGVCHRSPWDEIGIRAYELLTPAHDGEIL